MVPKMCTTRPSSAHIVGPKVRFIHRVHVALTPGSQLRVAMLAMAARAMMYSAMEMDSL